jgi:hypothetical protein
VAEELSVMPEGRQEAVRLGRFIAVSQPHDGRRKDLAARVAARARKVQETDHFIVIEASQDRAILLHPFGLATIDADLFSIVARELGATKTISSAQEYDSAVIAIVTSTSAAAQGERLAWRQLCLNTLAKLRTLLSCPWSRPGSAVKARRHSLPR